jgi:hypothetical protein
MIRGMEKAEYLKLYNFHKKNGTLDTFLTYKVTGRTKDKDHIRKYSLAYNRKNPEKRLFWSAKHRAKQKGLEFSIELSDIIIPEVCPVLGLKLEQGNENLDNSPSLDRVDSSKGYIKGNVHVISQRANSIKSNASLEELEKLVNYLKWLT